MQRQEDIPNVRIRSLDETWPEEKDVGQFSGVDDLEPKFPRAAPRRQKPQAVTNHAAPRNPTKVPLDALDANIIQRH